MGLTFRSPSHDAEKPSPGGQHQVNGLDAPRRSLRADSQLGVRDWLCGAFTLDARSMKGHSGPYVRRTPVCSRTVLVSKKSGTISIMACRAVSASSRRSRAGNTSRARSATRPPSPSRCNNGLRSAPSSHGPALESLLPSLSDSLRERKTASLSCVRMRLMGPSAVKILWILGRFQ